MLEAAKVTNPALPATLTIPLMDWERYIIIVANDLVREQSPKSLLQIRGRLYDLLVNCVPGDAIIKRLQAALVGDPFGKSMPEHKKHEIAHWCAYFEHRLQLGQKERFHLEALMARLMVCLKAG